MANTAAFVLSLIGGIFVLIEAAIILLGSGFVAMILPIFGAIGIALGVW